MIAPAPSSVRGQVRVLAGVVLSVVAVLVLATTPAAAHTRFTGSAPAADSRVNRMPRAVVLTFSDPILRLGAAIVVTGPDGAAAVGPPRVADNTVSQDLRPDAPAGSYRVRWRVTSGDGHPIDGEFGFIVQTESRAATAAPSPSAASPAAPSSVPSPADSPADSTSGPTADGGPAATRWLAPAAALAGVAALLLWRRTRY